jgi:Ca2+-binding EF-hand superfamily protein
MVESTVFEWVVTTAISVNAVCFGVQADWSVKNPGEAPPYEFEVIEYSLMAFFTFELLLRLLPNGAWLLNPKNPDLYWNMLDVFLVITSFLEFTARHFGVAVVKTNITRLCRLGRIVRAVRIIRIIRFFAELRVMVLAIGSSLRLLLWASCLLIMLMYLFAVSFLQIVEEEFQVARDFPERAHPRIDELKKHWGSLLSGVYTLYLSITNGISWHMAADPLMELSPLPLALYCAYIAVAVFCVLNTVTGIFVEKANHIAKVDEDCRLWAELDKRKKWVREVKTLFKRADSKGEGFLDYEAFALQLQDVRVQEHLKALGLDVMTTDIQTLFELFDFDGGGTIEINEFATALQRLNGGASAVDVASMKFALKVANQHIVDIIGAMQSMGFKVPRSHFGSNTLSRIGFDDKEADSE